MCPICTVGIAAGVGFSRWLGFSDAITGLWIGAIIYALSTISTNWLLTKLKNNNYWFIFLTSIVVLWALTIFPLQWLKIILPIAPKIWGINDLIFGSILGVIIASLAHLIENRVRIIKDGKALFHFQKIVIPISILLIVSAIMYFVV